MDISNNVAAGGLATNTQTTHSSVQGDEIGDVVTDPALIERVIANYSSTCKAEPVYLQTNWKYFANLMATKFYVSP